MDLLDVKYLICKRDWKTTIIQIEYRNVDRSVINSKTIDTVNFIKNKKYNIISVSNGLVEVNYDESDLSKTVNFSIIPSLTLFNYYLDIFYDPEYNEFILACKQLDNIPIEFIEKYIRIRKLKNLN